MNAHKSVSVMTAFTSGRRPARPHRARGFTLIEVLVVVAIIALLVAIMLPSLREARRQARWTLCLSNLHQISVALYSYQAEHKGSPPQWEVYSEQIADGLALWAGVSSGKGSPHATRLGMLYPRYIGKNENIYYCPDAETNGLLNKGTEGKTYASLYPWRNWGTTSWAYGSYEYRPRYFFKSGGGVVWVGAKYDKAKTGGMSIAADGFAGTWDSFGPFPAHTPIQSGPRFLYYSVAFMDGSAKGVRDFLRPSPADPAGKEFGTRAPYPDQMKPYYVNDATREGSIGATKVAPEYTPLRPGPENEPLPDDRAARETVVRTQRHIDRGWTFFDRR